MANTKKTAETAEIENKSAEVSAKETEKAETAVENAVEKSPVVEPAEEKSHTAELVEEKTAAAAPAKENGAKEVLKTLNSTVDSVAGTVDNNAAARKMNIGLEEEIAVRSVVYGGLNWISQRTNAIYRWNDIGTEIYIPFNDLITMNNTDQKFLREPYVILQDPRAVEYFRLTDVYKKIAVVESLEGLFKEGDLGKIETALRDIRNTSMRNVAINKIKELRVNHSLNNIDIIHLIEKELCFDLD